MSDKNDPSYLDGAARGAQYAEDSSNYAFETGNINQVKKGAFRFMRATDYTGKAVDYTKRPIRRKKITITGTDIKRVNGKMVIQGLSGQKLLLNVKRKLNQDKAADQGERAVRSEDPIFQSSVLPKVQYQDPAEKNLPQQTQEKKEYQGFTYVSPEKPFDYTVKKKEPVTSKNYKNKAAAEEKQEKEHAAVAYAEEQDQAGNITWDEEKGSAQHTDPDGDIPGEDDATEPEDYESSNESGRTKSGLKGAVYISSSIYHTVSSSVKESQSQNNDSAYIFTGSSAVVNAGVRPVSSTIQRLTNKDDTASAKMINAPMQTYETAKTTGIVMKAITAVIQFIASVVTTILPYLLAIIIVVGIVVTLASFLSTVSLKSTDEELSKIYLYVTELDTDFTISLLEEKNAADQYHYYINGASCSEYELKIQTNITSLIAYLDVKYQDYALDKFIYGIFGGTNVKDEVQKIHEALYSYEVKLYEKEEVVDQDDRGNDIVKKVKHKSISVKMEYFDTWLYNNRLSVLTGSEFEQYELLQSFGVFRTRKELDSPFPEGVLQLSTRYGYYNESTDKLKSDGIELLANRGDAVYAAFGGEIIESVPGDYVVIGSAAGEKEVKYTNIFNGLAAGVKIEKGDKIGEVGSRANASGVYIGFYYQKDSKEMCPFIFLTGCDNDYLASFGSEDIVQVALSQLGQVGGQPYWSWYGYGGRVEWCACFVSWCADQCGYIDSGVFVKHSGCITGTNVWKQRNQFQYRSSGYIPKAGDLIYFDFGSGNPPDHVGIVQSCDGTTVYTIEGNNGDAVRQATYNINSSSIYGYAIPNYPSSDDPAKNSLTIWNFFKAKGFNAYAIAGILGNLYQESNLDPGKYQNGGPGRGLAQWEYGSDRYSNLLAFAAKRGTSWQNINTQLEFIWHELNGGDPTTKSILDSRYGGINGLKNAKSITWAVEAFEKSFERAGIPNYTARNKYANEFYSKYA